MSNVVARYENGPLTFEVEEQVNGGQLVHAGTDTTKVAVADGTKTVLGVALYNALPEGTSAESTTSYGATVVDFSLPQPEVAVAFRGVFQLTNGHATTAIAFGDYVEVDGTGNVQRSPDPAHAGTYAASDADLQEQNSRNIIGVCVEPGGIAAGGSTKGLVRLSL